MNAQLSDSFFLPELAKLLSKNIDIIDFSFAIAYIDSGASLDTTLTFVEPLYLSLLASRRDAEIEEAYTDLDLFEAKYRNIKMKSMYAEIKSDDICNRFHKPLRYSYVTCASDG